MAFKSHQFKKNWDLEDSPPHWHPPTIPGTNPSLKEYTKHSTNSQTCTELPAIKHSIKHSTFTLSVLNVYATQNTPHPRCPSLETPSTHTTAFGLMEGSTWWCWKWLYPLLTTGRGFACVFPQDQPRPIWEPSRYVQHDPSSQKDGMEKTKRKQHRCPEDTQPDHLGRQSGLYWYSCPSQPSLSIILMAVFALLCANSHATPSSPNILHWHVYFFPFLKNLN